MTTEENKVNDPLKDEKQRIKKLQDPLLLFDIVKEIQKDGLIGEESTLLVLINKIMLDETGGGKDFIVSKTCNVLVPSNRYFHLTNISDKVFDYWQPIEYWETDENGKKHPVFCSWNTFVIHLEDPDKETINGQSFKVMSSGGTNVVKIIEHRVKHIKIDGKPVIIVTSLNTLVNNEGLRRWDTQRIDTSIEQTDKINLYKLKQVSNKIKNTPNWILREALHTNLQRKNVIIPFADALYDLLPNNLLTRTQTDKLLDYIKSSAVLYQYQREKHDNNTIIANGFDFLYGYYVFITLNSQGIPLNRSEEELVKVLQKESKPIPIKELSNKYERHSIQWIYNNREKLVNKGLIKIVYEFDEYTNREIEKICLNENSILVLKGFNEVLTSYNIFSFNGFHGFKEICEQIDMNRQKNGLKSLFACETRENRENRENLSINGLLKPCENHVKTENKNSFLHDKLIDLKEYCAKLEGVNTYENLCFNFDASFIEQCKQRGILKPDTKGGYFFDGT